VIQRSVFSHECPLVLVINKLGASWGMASCIKQESSLLVFLLKSLAVGVPALR
jgi:hypothetical protein